MQKVVIDTNVIIMSCLEIALFLPYFLNRTTLVAENKYNNSKPYYLIFEERIR